MKKRWVQIVNSMSGVHEKVIGQCYSIEAEDELQVIPCLGFYTWHTVLTVVLCLKGILVAGQVLYFSCTTVCLTSNLKIQRKKLYKS